MASRRYMILKYWFRKLKDVVFFASFHWKKYSDKGLKEGHWGKVCEGKHGNAKHYEESQIYCFIHSMCKVLPQRRLYHGHMVIICNNKTHQQCQIFQIKELKIPQLCPMHYHIIQQITYTAVANCGFYSKHKVFSVRYELNVM